MESLHLPLSYVSFTTLLYIGGTCFWAIIIIYMVFATAGFIIDLVDRRGTNGLRQRLDRDLVRVFPEQQLEQRIQWLDSQMTVARMAIGAKDS